jgi:hypothetical protein
MYGTSNIIVRESIMTGLVAQLLASLFGDCFGEQHHGRFCSKIINIVIAARACNYC